MECHKNNFSSICTTAYMKKFMFNKKGQLINKEGVIYSLIHQYDRSDLLKKVIEKWYS